MVNPPKVAEIKQQLRLRLNPSIDRADLLKANCYHIATNGSAGPFVEAAWIAIGCSPEKVPLAFRARMGSLPLSHDLHEFHRTFHAKPRHRRPGILSL
jgi:hypothetical protein